ncbi:molybdopterin-binding protein [Streptomyces sp. ISL-43]|uniref:molybdopterin-binding protein n=1 Tax=Streptomyces sp. ISL-43 TaxID=2819183 RepID=UPI0027E562BB|nr:molybdopterin-binding protein [Streptomyces sp. ISL-43]
MRIATGAPLPDGADAVLRREHGRTAPDARGEALLHTGGRGALPTGRDVRPRAGECRAAEILLPAGTVVTPAVLGLAAAAGHDSLTVHRPPTVEVLVLGDELLASGLPHGGRIRDALGPMLPAWLASYGARVSAVSHVLDDLDALCGALADSAADVVVTTGGTACGPVDHVHTALHRVGARLLVDGVRVRPGHPMLLAASPGSGSRTRHVVGLPGNPLAAIAGTLTLAGPLLSALGGRPPAGPGERRVDQELPGHPTDTRLVPVALAGGLVRPLAFHGPAMLRGLARADALAIVPPGGLPAEAAVELLPLPTA